MYCGHYIVHTQNTYTLWTLHSRYTEHCVLWTLRSTYSEHLHTVDITQYIHRTLCSVYCGLYIVHTQNTYTLWTLHSTYTEHYAANITQYIQRTLYYRYRVSVVVLPSGTQEKKKEKLYSMTTSHRNSTFIIHGIQRPKR